MFRPKLDPVTRFVRGLEPSDPGPPWTRRHVFDVGGLQSVGFGDGTEFLLVTSNAGRGVFDCVTGERVARDPDDSAEHEDPIALTALGIGPLAGQVVRMSGLFGGGLARLAADGWSVDPVWPNWPAEPGVVVAPGANLFQAARGSAAGITRVLPGAGEQRAFGFSPSGRTLVVASSADILVYNRD